MSNQYPASPFDSLADIRGLGNPAFLARVQDMLDTHVKKAAGYAGSDNPDTWANFREAAAWGLTPLQGCLVRMGDKYRRVQNLRRNAANDRVGESIKDTLMDLANYAIIAVCLLEEEEDEDLKQKVSEALTQAGMEASEATAELPDRLAAAAVGGAWPVTPMGIEQVMSLPGQKRTHWRWPVGGYPREWHDRPQIITLCGSTRFVEDFNKWSRHFTLQGAIVLSIEIVTTQARDEDLQHTNRPNKEMLDLLHLQKIEMSDVVFVINKDGYIGESTQREIAYARDRGKTIRYLEAMADLVGGSWVYHPEGGTPA